MQPVMQAQEGENVTAIQTNMFTQKKLKPQHVAIIEYMQTHNGITVLECIKYLNCTELRSRIAELKKYEYGAHDITEEPEYCEASGKWHKRYFLNSLFCT